jgi:hypothetical protein
VVAKSRSPGAKPTLFRFEPSSMNCRAPVHRCASCTAIYFTTRQDVVPSALGALTVVQYPDQSSQLNDWTRGFVRSKPTDTLSLLKDLNAGVAQRVRYESREVEGTQSPRETLDRGSGSCRDFAVLFTEAARQLGFGAGSSPAICTIQVTSSSVRLKVARPTLGPKCSYGARVGSPSIRPTAASGGGI